MNNFVNNDDNNNNVRQKAFSNMNLNRYLLDCVIDNKQIEKQMVQIEEIKYNDNDTDINGNNNKITLNSNNNNNKSSKNKEIKEIKEKKIQKEEEEKEKITIHKYYNNTENKSNGKLNNPVPDPNPSTIQNLPSNNSNSNPNFNSFTKTCLKKLSKAQNISNNFSNTSDSYLNYNLADLSNIEQYLTNINFDIAEGGDKEKGNELERKNIYKKNISNNLINPNPNPNINDVQVNLTSYSYSKSDSNSIDKSKLNHGHGYEDITIDTKNNTNTNDNIEISNYNGVSNDLKENLNDNLNSDSNSDSHNDLDIELKQNLNDLKQNLNDLNTSFISYSSHSSNNPSNLLGISIPTDKINIDIDQYREDIKTINNDEVTPNFKNNNIVNENESEAIEAIKELELGVTFGFLDRDRVKNNNLNPIKNDSKLQLCCDIPKNTHNIDISLNNDDNLVKLEIEQRLFIIRPITLKPIPCMGDIEEINPDSEDDKEDIID